MVAVVPGIRRLLMIGLTLGVTLSMGVGVVLAFPAVQSEGGLANIASPAADSVLSSVAAIIGTATDPNFAQYELAYAPDPPAGADAWQPIQPPVVQQVQDGVLGSWDTTHLSDGVYWIRLHVVRQDGTALEDQVRVLLFNATATPIPSEPPPPPTFLPVASPTPGPSPTSAIWQPPTRTPRPTLTPGGPTPTPRPVGLPDSLFRADRLRQAVWNGVLIGLGAFAFLGIYALLRMAVRGELPRGWRQFRAEFLNPLVDALRRRKS